jgi:hypothetical protein
MTAGFAAVAGNGACALVLGVAACASAWDGGAEEPAMHALPEANNASTTNHEREVVTGYE